MLADVVAVIGGVENVGIIDNAMGMKACYDTVDHLVDSL